MWVRCFHDWYPWIPLGHLGGFACTVPYKRLAQKMKKTRDCHSWINPLNRRTKAQNWQRWVAEQPVVNVQDNLCGCQTMMQQLSWFSSACFRNFDALLAAQVQCVPGMRHSVVAFVHSRSVPERPSPCFWNSARNAGNCSPQLASKKPLPGLEERCEFPVKHGGSGECEQCWWACTCHADCARTCTTFTFAFTSTSTSASTFHLYLYTLHAQRKGKIIWITHNDQ